MTKLRVALRRLNNIVIVKVLEQPESFRATKSHCPEWQASDGFVIESACEPELSTNRLYVWGNDKIADGMVSAVSLPNDEEAKKLFVRIARAVKEFNDQSPFGPGSCRKSEWSEEETVAS